jgi:hypothetical protein
MGKVILGLVIGLLIGGALTFFIFVGVPRASQAPGTPIQPPGPDQRGGTAQIVLKQDLFNEVLATIFRDMQSPTFQLASGNSSGSDGIEVQRAAFQSPGGCTSQITILREGSGVQTGLRLDNNRISGPLAFTGSYSSMFGCMQFTGWANATLELRFDKEQQTVFGNINVDTVNLDGVNPVLNGLVTPFVQSTLNSRVNPLKIIDGKQIAIDVPITSAGGKLEGSVDDVRADLSNNALNLYIAYTFAGARGL